MEEKYIEQMAKQDTRISSMEDRLDKIEETQDALKEMASSIKVIANEQLHQTETMREIKKTQEVQADKLSKIEIDPLKEKECNTDKIYIGAIGSLIALLLGALLRLAGII